MPVSLRIQGQMRSSVALSFSILSVEVAHLALILPLAQQLGFNILEDKLMQNHL